MEKTHLSEFILHSPFYQHRKYKCENRAQQNVKSYRIKNCPATLFQIGYDRATARRLIIRGYSDAIRSITKLTATGVHIETYLLGKTAEIVNSDYRP